MSLFSTKHGLTDRHRNIVRGCLYALLLSLVLIAYTSTSFGGSGSHNEKPNIPVIVMTHHKTGTVQMWCILEMLAYHNQEDVHIGMIKYPEMVSSHIFRHHISFCRYDPWNQIQTAKYKTNYWFAWHGMETCPRNKKDKAVDTDCPRDKKGTPICMDVDNDGCMIPLPPGAANVVHVVRHPIDTVVSAYMYHNQKEDIGEDWIESPAFFTAMQVFREANDPKNQHRLKQLGFENHFPANTSYKDYLTSLPMEQGVMLEMWQSWGELTQMVRQYGASQRYKGGSNYKFEALKTDFDGTVLQMLRKFGVNTNKNSVTNSLIEQLKQSCDPGAWNKQDLESSSHVTEGKAADDVRKAVEKTLLSNLYVQKNLCKYARLLEYNDDERCQ